MKNIIVKSYKRDRDSDLGTFGTHIDEQMTDNPDFSDAPPALTELRTLNPDYGVSVANAKTREKVAVSIKKDKKARMIQLLDELAAYVTLKCNGDRTKLLSSGFLISGEKGEVAEPTISKLDVELGPPGIITISVKRMGKVRAYFHQYSVEPPTADTVWKSETRLQPSHTFTGLTSGKTYWLRIVVLSSTGAMVYSPVESRIIQ
jgi:hypothetical protein